LSIDDTDATNGPATGTAPAAADNDDVIKRAYSDADDVSDDCGVECG